MPAFGVFGRLPWEASSYSTDECSLPTSLGAGQIFCEKWSMGMVQSGNALPVTQSILF
jgi:hypothetical protein